MKYDLFNHQGSGATSSIDIERRELSDRSWVMIVRGWWLGSDALFDDLDREVDWRQGRRMMFDEIVDEPRLSRCHRMTAASPITSGRMSAMKRAAEDLLGLNLTDPFLNYYRDGNDSVAFHADRELRHTPESVVAIVTLGSQRPFHIRPDRGGPAIDLSPATGDLLVMGGACQHEFEHAVPKTRRGGPRISVSMRWPRPGKPRAPGAST